MLIVETIPILRREIRRWQQQGKRIAYVATKGKLHEGHSALIKAAEQTAEQLCKKTAKN